MLCYPIVGKYVNHAEFNRKCCKLGIRLSNSKERLKDLYCARIDNIIKDTAFEWANKHIGDEWIWSSPIHTWWTELYFLKEEDALAFKLTFKTHLTQYM